MPVALKVKVWFFPGNSIIFHGFLRNFEEDYKNERNFWKFKLKQNLNFKNNFLKIEAFPDKILKFNRILCLIGKSKQSKRLKMKVKTSVESSSFPLKTYFAYSFLKQQKETRKSNKIMLSKKNKVINIAVINFIAIASEYQIKLSHVIFHLSLSFLLLSV